MKKIIGKETKATSKSERLFASVTIFLRNWRGVKKIRMARHWNKRGQSRIGCTRPKPLCTTVRRTPVKKNVR